MQFIVIGILGLFAVYLLRKPSASVPPTTAIQPVAGPPTPGTTGNPSPAATAGNIISTVAGAIQSGAAIGVAIDTALQGGKPSPLTTTTAEVGGAAIVTTVALVGLIGFAAAFPIGTIAIAVVIVVAVLAYAVASIITDIQRLQYGQAGARNDFGKSWLQVFNDGWTRLRSNPNYNNYTDSQLSDMWMPFVDGFCESTNENTYRQWMKGPRGLLSDKSDYGQAKWGLDRGYFVGPITSNGALNFDESLLHTNQMHSAVAVTATNVPVIYTSPGAAIGPGALAAQDAAEESAFQTAQATKVGPTGTTVTYSPAAGTIPVTTPAAKPAPVITVQAVSITVAKAASGVVKKQGVTK